MIHVLVLSVVLAAGQGSSNDSYEATIERLMKAASIPGLSIAVLHQGKSTYRGAFGTCRVNRDEAVTQRTVFTAASLSKPVFAYAVLRLVDRGRLDLDTPLVSYLDWDAPQHDEIDSDHYAALARDPRFKAITARMVLSHTTGMPNWARNSTLSIHAQPGSRFSYSGEGYVLLQKIMCDMQGRGLDAIIDDEVFKPLEMKDSFFIWRAQLAERYGGGHDLAGKPVSRLPKGPANAAGSLLTTATDYARFMQAVVSGEGLSKASHEAYLRPQVWVDPNCVFCTGNQPSTKKSDVIAWGLGWGIQRCDASDWIWHWGSEGFCKNWVQLNLTTGDGLVYFSNSARGLAIRDDLVTAILGGNHPVFAWLQEPQHDSSEFQFARDVWAGDMAAALARYSALTTQRGSKTVFDENYLNAMGYGLMGDRIEDAITVFKLNVEAYPNASNPYDSLGEAYMNNGEAELAIANYLKSLERNPENANARKMLKQLRQR